MALLKDYHHFDGQRWATGYIVNALAYQDAKAPHTGKTYSEAMIMGVNGGISAGYFTFHYEGYDPQVELLTYYPYNNDLIAVFDRLNIPKDVRQTDNPTKAAANIINALAKGQPAIVFADMFTLSYTGEPAYSDGQAMVPILVYGHENDRVLIADRARVPLEVSVANLLEAQSKVRKLKNRTITLGAPDARKLPEAVRAGIEATIAIFTEPPHFAPQAASSFGFAGMQKWANELVDTRTKNGWFRRYPRGAAFYNVLKSSYRSLELYFTGGNGARDLYADFLDEAADLLSKPALRQVAVTYRASASMWRELAEVHLPESVPLFKQTRTLMRRDYDLFMNQGAASIGERRDISAELRGLREQAANDFPLSEDDCASLRDDLHDRIMAISSHERGAIDMLREAIS